MKEYNRKTNYKEKGVTLVALVVTIVVLLILASIALSAILQEKGLLSRTKDAVKAWNNSSDVESAKIVNASNKIREHREKRNTATEDIGITDSDGNPIDRDSIIDYYGEEITYNGKKYQLFLADWDGKYSNGEPRLWLQLKEYVNYSNGELDSTQLSDTNSTFWQLNPDLKNTCGEELSKINTSSLGGALIGSLKLCNTSNWNSTYVTTEDLEKGVYATGGVSVEMYCDSYNQARGKTIDDDDYFQVKAFKVNGTYGYGYIPYESAGSMTNGYGYWTDSTNYPISTTTKNGMYRITDISTYIASPSATVSNMCFVYGVNGSLSHNYFVSVSCKLRPALSVPTNFPIEFE